MQEYAIVEFTFGVTQEAAADKAHAPAAALIFHTGQSLKRALFLYRVVPAPDQGDILGDRPAHRKIGLLNVTDGTAEAIAEVQYRIEVRTIAQGGGRQFGAGIVRVPLQHATRGPVFDDIGRHFRDQFRGPRGLRALACQVHFAVAKVVNLTHADAIDFAPALDVDHA